MIKIATKLGYLLVEVFALSACSGVPQTSNEYKKALDDTEQLCAACALVGNDLLVDGSSVDPEWEPFGLAPGLSVVIRGGRIEGNALSDDSVPLVQAFVSWKQGQENS
ncbi:MULTISPECIES: hypothetical protein [Xenorhabdus]|uniref:hypothetical protein n=1 Tax=Xenorhabdus TaxID=626 RepID=UPI0006485C18|nr:MULTISPECIES: hypothetical protein [Xenorhabdus]